MKSGSCFCYKKQGYLLRDCPIKGKTSIHKATAEPVIKPLKGKGKPKVKADKPPSYNSILKQINTCSIKDRQKILEVFSQDGDSRQDDF